MYLQYESRYATIVEKSVAVCNHSILGAFLAVDYSSASDARREDNWGGCGRGGDGGDMNGHLRRWLLFLSLPILCLPLPLPLSLSLSPFDVGSGRGGDGCDDVVSDAFQVKTPTEASTDFHLPPPPLPPTWDDWRVSLSPLGSLLRLFACTHFLNWVS